MTSKPKRYSLRPVAYDEVSLVDEGVAGSADVLIMKRKTPPRTSVGRTRAGSHVKDPGSRPSKVPNTGAKVVPPKKSSGRSQSNPCSTKTNSTGAKAGGGKGASQRGQNWQDARHPRDDQGQFGSSSGKSKSKYGKGGTTKSKLDAACRANGKKKSGGSPIAQQSAMNGGAAKGRRARRKSQLNVFQNGGRRPVRKSALSTWSK